MAVHGTLPAVRRSVRVNRSVDDAFRVFTEEISSWWPFGSHSIHGEDAVAAIFEGGTGGRLYERARDGSEAPWGRLLAWEPPQRVLIEWKVNPNAIAPTEVEVTFRDDDGATIVELEHRGWERLAGAAEAARESYDTGWEVVLARYADRVGGRLS